MIIGILASWMIFMLARWAELQCEPSIATTLASTSLLATLTASDGLHLLSMHQELELAAEHAAGGVDLLDREIDAPQLPFRGHRRRSGLRASTRRSRSALLRHRRCASAPNGHGYPATQDLIPISASLRVPIIGTLFR